MLRCCYGCCWCCRSSLQIAAAVNGITKKIRPTDWQDVTGGGRPAQHTANDIHRYTDLMAKSRFNLKISNATEKYNQLWHNTFETAFRFQFRYWYNHCTLNATTRCIIQRMHIRTYLRIRIVHTTCSFMLFFIWFFVVLLFR